MNLTQKELEEWERFIYETTNGATKQAAQNGQPVTVNVFLNIDNSINIQAVLNGGNASSRLTDNRQRLNEGFGKYLPSMYQPGNMEETAARIAATPNYTYLPLTKEEREKAGGFGYSF